MKKRTLWAKHFASIVIAFIPAILGYLAKAYILPDPFLITVFSIDSSQGAAAVNTEISVIKDCLWLASVLFTAIPLQVYMILNKERESRAIAERDGLLKFLRDQFQYKLEEDVKTKYPNINIRVYLPKHKIISVIGASDDSRKKKLLMFRTVLKLKNISGFCCNNAPEGLYFHTGDNAQGLVGKCYTDKDMLYEDDLRRTDTAYHLTGYQKDHTRNTRFCLCFPLFNEQDKVVAVISFDSQEPITIRKTEKNIWCDNVTDFCLTLEQTVPHIFK
jgi:hypothetical protein